MDEQLSKSERKAQSQVSGARKAKLKKVWWGIFWIAILALIIYSVLPSGPGDDNGGAVVSGEDWVRGNPDGAVTLVEYSDFQCPACGAYFPIVEQVVEEFGENLRFVYRHYPLSQIHPLAIRAGQATEAAGMQGRFWDMHDLLFERQDDWTRSGDVENTFADYATEIGLDREIYLSDFSESTARSAVLADRSEAVRLGLSGTPSFFLQGEKIDNPASLEAFRQLIREALEKEGIDPFGFEVGSVNLEPADSQEEEGETGVDVDSEDVGHEVQSPVMRQ